MKICLFSDIHGNGPAFRKMYRSILSTKADFNIFLGDICGYYYDQIEIFELIRSIPDLIAIRGNHDQIFLDILNGNETLRKYYKQAYGNSMENLINSRNAEFADWLHGLPSSYIHHSNHFVCFHGSPKNPLEEYVYPDSDHTMIEGIQARYIFLGHTHYRMKINRGQKTIINPGSVGQPRDKRPSGFAIIDLDRKRVSFQEINYDSSSLKRQIIASGDDDKYLYKILFLN